MSSTQPTLLCTYHYDPLDRLTSHTRSTTPVRQRFYCKSRLATEIQGAIAYSIVQHDDQLLAQQLRQDAALDTRLLATDLQRSVLRTLNKETPLQPIAYSPYGHRPVPSGLLSLLGFNGERPDPLTGHYLLGNGYRAFNPVLMRFNSPDNLSPFGIGGLNPYAYCEGEPVLGSDATGHWKAPGIINSLWKGIKNVFGRTPSKLRTPASAGTPNSKNLASTQPHVVQEYGIATHKEILQARATSSPKNPAQQNGTIPSQGRSFQQFKSREELELQLQLFDDVRKMRAYLAGDEQALEKPFNLSGHREFIREQGF